MSGMIYKSQIDMRVAPTEPNHLARLSDVLDMVDGKTKRPVRLYLGTNFVSTYDSTSKTLTQTTAADVLIDNVVIGMNDRVLFNGQTDKTQNGIYKLTTLGSSLVNAIFTRDDDFDISVEIFEGMRVFVTEGDTYAGTVWKLTGTGPFTLDTSNIEFIQDIVKYTEVVELTFTAIGDDTNSEFTFNHNFGTKNVTFEAFNADGENIGVLIRRTSINDFKVIFGNPLAVGDDITIIARAVVNPS